MPNLRTSAIAVVIVVGAGLSAGAASAMPAGGLAPAAKDVAASNIQDARWVCGPYRCWCWLP